MRLPEPISRIEIGGCGLSVVARTELARDELKNAARSSELLHTYVALVHGRVPDDWQHTQLRLPPPSPAPQHRRERAAAAAAAAAVVAAAAAAEDAQVRVRVAGQSHGLGGDWMEEPLKLGGTHMRESEVADESDEELAGEFEGEADREEREKRKREGERED